MSVPLNEPWPKEYRRSEPPPPPPNPRRKRHPFRALFSTLIVLGLLLAGGYFAADALVRSVVTTAIQQGVVAEFGLNSLNQVHVNLGRAPILQELFRQRLKSVVVTVDDYQTANLTATLRMSATNVPFSTSAPVGKLVVTATMTTTALTSFLVADGSLTKDVTITVQPNGDLRLGSSIAVAGKTVPVAVTATVSVAQGRLILKPTSLATPERTFTAAQAAGTPYRALVEPRSGCLATELPAALSLTRVSSSPGLISLSLGGSGIALSSLGTKGTC